MTEKTTLEELRRRGYRPGDENNLDLVDYEFIDRQHPWMQAIRRYFRYEVIGTENVPTSGPGIIVTPHSLVSIDGVLLGEHIYHETGRLTRALTDHDMFKIPGVREAFLRIGVVDGIPQNAHRLLERGELLFIMPGGAKEAWQPSRNRYQLFWRGHHGFIKVALRGGAPIIPSVCIGAEEALYMPINALEWGKRLLGKRLPIMFGIGALGLIPMPFPTKFTAYVGEPIYFDESPGAADDETIVRQCHERVVAAMQELINVGLARRTSVWR